MPREDDNDDDNNGDGIHPVVSDDDVAVMWMIECWRLIVPSDYCGGGDNIYRLLYSLTMVLCQTGGLLSPQNLFNFDLVGWSRGSSGMTKTINVACQHTPHLVLLPPPSSD